MSQLRSGSEGDRKLNSSRTTDRNLRRTGGESWQDAIATLGRWSFRTLIEIAKSQKVSDFCRATHLGMGIEDSRAMAWT